MDTSSRTELARDILLEFAQRTGVYVGRKPRRYLWTDAFAVCTFLGLYKRTRKKRFLNLALKLVEQVHHVLGQHREDDIRGGWLSGLSPANGELHPTAGGLRIGKSLPERGTDDPFDPDREWDRDGQYYHYLTKWMHALSAVYEATGESRYLNWAMELATVAHDAFTFQPDPNAPGRLFWKMSIDLSRPLVESMGHHDPLDGLVTYCRLQAASDSAQEEAPLNLKAQISDLAGMCRGRSWVTDDPLGLGGLLFDSLRVAGLMREGHLSSPDLLTSLLRDAAQGFRAYLSGDPLGFSAGQRLAFRELGLAIGLHGLPRMRAMLKNGSSGISAGDFAALLAPLEPYLVLTERVETFWLNPDHQQARSWTEHPDINQVMLAASLVPDGFLEMGDNNGVD